LDTFPTACFFTRGQKFDGLSRSGDNWVLMALQQTSKLTALKGGYLSL
jgi:hypothetical protein